MEKSLPIGRQRYASERRALAFVLALAWIAVGPRGVSAQQQPELATSIQVDSTGAVVRSISSEKGPAYHPTRVLVNFKRGAPKDFLPGSGPAKDFQGTRISFSSKPPTVSPCPRPWRATGQTPTSSTQSPTTWCAPRHHSFGSRSGTTSGTWSRSPHPRPGTRRGTASDVVVAIIDTGIDFRPP